MNDSTKFSFKSTKALKENPFFTSIFIFCSGKEDPKALITVEASCLSLLGEALGDKKKGQSDEDAYSDSLLDLIEDTQKSLTINFIDTEYERSKQGISKNCIN